MLFFKKRGNNKSFLKNENQAGLCSTLSTQVDEKIDSQVLCFLLHKYARSMGASACESRYISTMSLF